MRHVVVENIRSAEGAKMALDLVIRNGQIVTGGDLARADIGISGEQIVAIGQGLTGTQDIDATGKLVLPGGIDAHVHLTNPDALNINWVDDFQSGTSAAVAGGITTVGNMTFVRPDETPLGALQREGEIAKTKSIADVFMHPVLGAMSDVTEATLDTIPQLMEQGCNTIKYFMMFPQFDAHISRYIKATRIAGNHQMLTMIHCEDYPLIEDATNHLHAAGKSAVRYYPDAHPVISEVVAVQRAAAIAEQTNAPVYVVHLSSQRALTICAEAQSRGVPVYVEVRPIYLHLTRERFEEPDGAKYVGNPPLRETHDLEALWRGIQQGSVHTVCTDHAPWSLEDKLDPTLNIETARPGVENLQVMLPMLYSDGVRTGKISISRFVEVVSTNVAKLFGLYPRKGTISVGSDADVVVFDPELTRTIDADMLKSNADYSVFAGMSVTGWPVVTIRRGEIVFQNDQVVGRPGSGQVVWRGLTQLL